MQAADEIAAAVFAYQQLSKEPSLKRFFSLASYMIAIRDGDVAPSDDALPGVEDWCAGLPLTDLRCKVVRDAAFARRIVGYVLAEIEEQARQIAAEKRGVANARP